MRYRLISIQKSIGAAFIILTAIALSTAVDVLLAADDDFFLEQQINVRGIILGSREADFNGDGLVDLALIHSDPSGRRLLSSFIQREFGRFPPTPTQNVALSSSANIAQCVDLDNDRASELLIVDKDGVWAYRFGGDGFVGDPDHLIEETTIFMAGTENGLLPEDCIQTVSGRHVAFIPTFDGFSLWEYAGGAFRRWAELPVAHRCAVPQRPVKLFGNHSPSGMSQFVVSIPEVFVHDGNADGRDDVYLLWPDRLIIHLQNPAGGFAQETGILFRFQEFSDGSLFQARLMDYDGDDRLDVICSRSDGGISGARTEIAFFNAADILQGRRVESHRIVLSDACGNLMIDDFNLDGSPELVVPAVELGILSTVQKMITKKTDLHVLIYPIDNSGRPADEPQIRREISCRLNFEQSDPTADIRLNWEGDFDGDGLADLLVADGGGQLMFFRGTTDEYIENKASLVLDITGPNKIRAIELNNDGRDDLVVIHKPSQGMTRLTLLVTNRIS